MSLSLSSLLEGLDTRSILLMGFEAIFVPWLMFDRKNLSPFAARKLCHAGSGMVMMLLNCNVAICRVFIYIVSAVSLCMNWELCPVPNFWFATRRDKGVTLYLILVSTWVYLGLSLRVLAPVFLADPAGAVIGKLMTNLFPKDNRQWIGSKTIAGSLAVFIVTFATLFQPIETIPRLAVSLLATLGEAIGGPYDNLVIALVVITFYRPHI